MNFKSIERIMKDGNIEDYINSYEHAFPPGDSTHLFERANVEAIEIFVNQYILLAQELAGANVPHFFLGSYNEAWHRESVLKVYSFGWIGWWKLTLLRDYRKGDYQDDAIGE